MLNNNPSTSNVLLSFPFLFWCDFADLLADLNPIWMACGATFTLAGAGTGERSVPAKDFFLGYRKVDMQPHEILLKVRACAGHEAHTQGCSLVWLGVASLGLIAGALSRAGPLMHTVYLSGQSLATSHK